MASTALPARAGGKLAVVPLAQLLLFASALFLGMCLEQLRGRSAPWARIGSWRLSPAAAGAGPSADQHPSLLAQEGSPVPALDFGGENPLGMQSHKLKATKERAAKEQAPAPPWQFSADGYRLPPECEKHAPLYPAIFNHLRPWFLRGVTKQDMDACAPVAPKGYDLNNGTPVVDPQNPRFRMLSWDSELYVTSGGLERSPPGAQAALYYHKITEIQRAAKRFGLPNIEFGIAFGDNPPTSVKEGDAGFPAAMCPLMTMSKAPAFMTIPVPSGEFIRIGYDEWVERMLTDGKGTKWEQQDERAVGRWNFFPTFDTGHRDRFGHEEYSSRERYTELSKAGNYTFTSLMGLLEEGAHMPLSEQRKFKYTFSTDGFSTSARFAKVLATGQVVIKEDSILEDWFYPAVQPWVHYVPTGYNGWEEIDRIVQFLRQHDELARAIAANGQRFAATHLTSEGRQCYIKVLFEELAKLQRFPTPGPQDFPSIISYDEDVRQFVHGDQLNTTEPEL